MRLHRNLVYTTIDSLNAIFNEGEYADKVVARALKRHNVGEVLIEIVAETIYEIVRWKRLYEMKPKLKRTFDRDNPGECFLFGCFKRLPNS
jgi:16S rRNA (cytosine967-C5)-methyltransferase